MKEGIRLLGVALLNCCLACAVGAPAIDSTRDPEMATGMDAAGAADDMTGVAGAAHVSTDWCAVRAVLEAKCQRCHAAPSQHGAPFPLVTYEDTQVMNRRGEARFVTIAAVLEEGFMPPSFITLEPPVAPLSTPEHELLVGWCRAGGLPAEDGACEPR